MIAEIFGIDGVIALVVCAVILFSSSRLPKLLKNIGLARREFRSTRAEAQFEELSLGEAAVIPGDFEVRRAMTNRKS